MKTYIIEHVPFETPGVLEQLPNYEIIKMYEDFEFPKVEDLELLIILGGPMSVHDAISWLPQEKLFIHEVLQADKPILGICLGAQLIAEAIGGEVYPNPGGLQFHFESA